MDCSLVQREIERHKMAILVGLTNLTRAELSSCEHVLETLYNIFSADLNASQMTYGRVAVLISGMGLVSETGRVAFYQAINQCCATVIQLLYGEVHCAKMPIHVKTVHQPTSGNAIHYEKRHEDKPHKVGFFIDSLPED